MRASHPIQTSTGRLAACLALALLAGALPAAAQHDILWHHDTKG